MGPGPRPPRVRSKVMKSLDTEYETLALDEAAPGVVVVTLNRPDRHKAMTNTMFDELKRLALDFDHEHGCKIVALTGAGKAFSTAYNLAAARDVPSLRAQRRPPRHSLAPRA